MKYNNQSQKQIKTTAIVLFVVFVALLCALVSILAKNGWIGKKEVPQAPGNSQAVLEDAYGNKGDVELTQAEQARLEKGMSVKKTGTSPAIQAALENAYAQKK